MEHTFDASTVTLDDAGYDSLREQILTSKGKPEAAQDIREKQPEAHKESGSTKKFVFKKGDESFEIDEDYSLEFMADKKPTTLTLRELKERAAGDIAVKNRMHALAEEKKSVQQTFKQFAELAKTDPLAALEFISGKAKDADSEFEYTQYIEKLAEQAEKLGQMDEKDRKAWELEKKLLKAEQDLSLKERTESVVLRKQDLLESYPEIGDQQFSQMVDAVLANDELMDGLEDEDDVMDKVEELIQETLTQRDIASVISEINPAYSRDSALIFSISDIVRQNPDFDEEDVRDIVRELVGTQRDERRQKDIRTLSSKAREAAPAASLRLQGASEYDLLTQKLLDRKQELHKTPLYKR